MSSVDKKTKKRFWRSLAELDGDPEFQKFLDHEFAEPMQELPPNSPERRRFMKLMGASFALAGATGCRWEEDYILPYTRRPEGMVPGEPRHFATAMDMGGVGTGLLVKSFDNRPIKVEGNPQHADSRGACNVYHQASVLDLYDPDRSKKIAQFAGGDKSEATLVDLKKFIRPLFRKLRENQGQGLRILGGHSSSPSLAAMKERLLEALPEAKWLEYEPVNDDNSRAGSRMAFGGYYRVLPSLDRADVILTLDSDFLFSERMSLRVAPDFVAGRQPETGKMNRLYAVESALTMTGGMADHRLPLPSTLVKAVAAALDASISSKVAVDEAMGPAQARPKAAFLDDPKVAAFLAAVEKELLENRGRSIVLAGEQQPPEVHALAHRLNAILGNVGSTVSYVPDPTGDRPAHIDSIVELAEDMNAGKVDTLIVIDTNPVFTAPANLSFASALGKVKNKVHLGLYEDETARKCDWHVPMAHYLEAWGDVRGYDGAVSIQQPMIAPLYEGFSAIEFVALVLGDSTTDGLGIVKRTLADRVADERLWRRAVHDGVLMGSSLTPVQPPVKPIAPLKWSDVELGSLTAQNGKLELVLHPDSKIHDGRFANNGWLQELPDMMTKLTWDNAAIINPVTAKELGVENGTLVTLTIDGNSLVAPALVSPGQARGSIRIAYGYGRTAAGIVGVGGYLEHGMKDDLGAELAEGDVEPVGVDAYALRTTKVLHFATGLSVQPTGKRYRLATTEHTHAIKDDIGQEGISQRLGELVRSATLEEYKKHPDFAQHAVHHPPLLSLWVEPVAYNGHKWGMSIDLNRCIGCNACLVACRAENNVPVVGKERVLMGREMDWIRVDRYYAGDPDNPELAHQVVLCQQCEHAPCEQVCPVGATMHSREGLNDMIYNRCIGTRYCSNNCPYKVRRFNYFHMNEKLKHDKNQTLQMVKNPEVTVRFRGVMEKCTFCVQRIQRVKIRSKNERRKISDGEITPACAQTCPTQAIVFGDLNDPKSRVVANQNLPRSYAMLEELNVRPRVEYLARVTNPNSELVAPEAEQPHGEHGS